uniref:Uncharacterized protein LOC100177484 n=1 Tax=Phallusia mammillata TaxID=59560 RepID=A0A6F9DHK2_9ASCI|nr:uncharacterized protein LOC100177484 [Phallusia mammillata]
MMEGFSSTLEVRYTLQDTVEVIAQLELATGTKFVVLQKQKFYGNPDWIPTSKGRIYWEHPGPEDGISIPIPFDGQPFMFVGRKVLGCHQGVDKDKERKARRIEEKHKDGTAGRIVKQRKTRISKKVNCPAQIYSLQIAKFPEYEIPGNTARDRRESAKRLKDDLANNIDVGYNIIYITKLPLLTDHEGHLISGEAIRPPNLVTDERDILIEKCAQVSQTISNATNIVRDGPYLKDLLSTLQQVQNSVLEHVSSEEIAEIEESIGKQEYNPDMNEVTIEIEIEKQENTEFNQCE